MDHAIDERASRIVVEIVGQFGRASVLRTPRAAGKMVLFEGTLMRSPGRTGRYGQFSSRPGSVTPIIHDGERKGRVTSVLASVHDRGTEIDSDLPPQRKP